MGRSQNYGPLLVVDYITAPNIQGYQNGILILRTTHVRGSLVRKLLELYYMSLPEDNGGLETKQRGLGFRI